MGRSMGACALRVRPVCPSSTRPSVGGSVRACSCSPVLLPSSAITIRPRPSLPVAVCPRRQGDDGRQCCGSGAVGTETRACSPRSCRLGQGRRRLRRRPEAIANGALPCWRALAKVALAHQQGLQHLLCSGHTASENLLTLAGDPLLSRAQGGANELETRGTGP